MTSHKHGLAARRVSKWRHPKSLLSRRISSGQWAIQKLKLQGVGKAECLVDIGDDKKIISVLE